MNWYKLSQSRENIGGMFRDLQGSSRLYYPISGAKKVSGKNEWTLDMSKAPELSKPFEEAEVGDGVWDYNMHSALGDGKPIWTVVWMDEKKGTLTVVPTEDNPLSSGVGAGGRLLEDFDYLVQSGEFETEQVDRILQIIGSKSYHQPADVAYVLLGTVPMRFGANGAEGGWYNAHDTRSNRGGMRGMDDKEIVMKDAAALKKMGFTLPVGALEGKIDSMTWTDFVNRGSVSSRASKEMRFDSEEKGKDIVDLIASERSPKVVGMMFERLVQSGAKDEQVAEAVKAIGAKEGGNGEVDPYFLVKENAIGWAKRHGMHELILPFVESEDSDVSSYAMTALVTLGAADPIVLMRKARRMKALYELSYLAQKEGRVGEAVKILEDRMGDIRSPETSSDKYYADQILKIFAQMQVSARIQEMKNK